MGLVKMAAKRNKKKKKCRQCKGEVCIHEQPSQQDEDDMGAAAGPTVVEQCTAMLDRLLKEKQGEPEEILRIGAQAELFQLGMDPVCVTAAIGNLETMTRFLEAGTNIRNNTIADGSTPLMLATQNRHVDMAQLLLKNGADVTIENQDKNNSFMLAVKTGDAKLVNELWIYRGTLDINHSNVNGQTALHIAAEKMWDACVQFLLTNGASVNAKNKLGWTALMISTMKGDRKTTEKLLTSGADILLEDKAGFTALCWAIESEKPEIFKVIIERMQQKDREQFVKNRVERLRNPFESMETDEYHEKVLLPMWQILATQQDFKEPIFKQKLVPNLMALIQKHMKHHALVAGTCCVIGFLMCHNVPLVAENFVQQFVRARGPDICVKAMKAVIKSAKEDYDVLATCFFPLVCISFVAEGKEWIEKNAAKITPYAFLKKEFKLPNSKSFCAHMNDFFAKGFDLWAQFWGRFEAMQMVEQDRKMAELLEEEEKERFRLSKKRERKKEKRHKHDKAAARQPMPKKRSPDESLFSSNPLEQEKVNADETTNQNAAINDQGEKEIADLCSMIEGKMEKHLPQRSTNEGGITIADYIDDDDFNIENIEGKITFLSSEKDWVTVQTKKDKPRTCSKLEGYEQENEAKVQKVDRKNMEGPKDRKGKKQRWADIAKSGIEPKDTKTRFEHLKMPVAGCDVKFGTFDYEVQFPTLGSSGTNVANTKNDHENWDDVLCTDNTDSDSWKFEVYSSPPQSRPSSEFDFTGDNFDFMAGLEDLSSDINLQAFCMRNNEHQQVDMSASNKTRSGQPSVLLNIAQDILVNSDKMPKQRPDSAGQNEGGQQEISFGASERVTNWINNDSVPYAELAPNENCVKPQTENQAYLGQCFQQDNPSKHNLQDSKEIINDNIGDADYALSGEKEQQNVRRQPDHSNVAVILPIGHSRKKKIDDSENQAPKLEQKPSDIKATSFVENIKSAVERLNIDDKGIEFEEASKLRSENEEESNVNPVPVFPGFHDDSWSYPDSQQKDSKYSMNFLRELQLANYYQRMCAGDGASLFSHDFPYYSSAMGISEDTIKKLITEMHHVFQQTGSQQDSECPGKDSSDQLLAQIKNQRTEQDGNVTSYKIADVTGGIVYKASSENIPDSDDRKPFYENRFQQTNEGKSFTTSSQQTTYQGHDVISDNVFNHHSIQWNHRSTRWRQKLTDIWNMSPVYIKRIGDMIFPRDFQEQFTIPYSDGFAILGFLLDGSEIAIHVINMATRPISRELLDHLTSQRVSHYFLAKYRAYAVEDNLCYLAMDLYEYTLSEYLPMLNLDVSLDPLSVNKLVWQLLKGISSLHVNCGLLCGNLMPSNVLLDVDEKLHLSEYGLPRPTQNKYTLISSLSIHADRECWTPTEVVTESGGYSTQSDIQVTGMMLYYILSGGKHPYGDNNLEIQVSIQQNWPQMIYINEEINNLLAQMLGMPPQDRPNVADLLKHPYFWAEEKRLRFVLIAGSDVLRDMKLGVPTTGGPGDTMIDILNFGNNETTFTDWISEIDSVIMQEMRLFRQYKNNLVELVLFVYNCCLHFEKLSSESRDVMDEPCKYFLTKFPTLFMSVYTAIKKTERCRKICYKPFF